jgi:mitochondrial fission protein ELM1
MRTRPQGSFPSSPAARSLYREGKIIVVKSRHQGDFNNTMGIASLVADKLGLGIQSVELSVRSNLLIPLLVFALRQGAQSTRMAQLLYRLFFRSNSLRNMPARARFVVSTLGSGEAPGAFLAKATGAIGIHLGRPKRIPASLFDLVISHQGHTPSGKELALPISPSQVRLGQAPPIEKRRDVLLAVGGNTEEVVFPDAFWIELCRRSAELAVTSGLNLSLTTSPRTGRTIEDNIRTWLASMPVRPREAYFYSSNGTGNITSLLVSARIMIVSCESVSMISEGIAAGSIVVAAFHKALPPSERISRFLQHQCRDGRLVLWDIDSDGPPEIDKVEPLRTCWSEDLWASLREVLQRRGWAHTPER